MPDILDNLTRAGDVPPALNATSDMPAIDQPPALPAEQPAEQPHEQPPPEPAPHPDARERREQRFAELTRQRDAERERANKAIDGLTALTEQNKALIERFDKLLVPPPAAPVVEARPQREAFDTPDEYDEALISFSARRAAREAQIEWERRQQEREGAAQERQRAEQAARTQAEQHQAEQQIFADWSTRREAAIEKYPDFEQVAEQHPNVTLPMRDALWLAEDGPEIAYYLGKHQDEAAAIMRLHPVQQVAAIARLGAKLAAPPPAPVPPPPPINPLRGGNNAAAQDIYTNEPSMDDYAATRMTQLRGERKSGMLGMPRGS